MQLAVECILTLKLLQLIATTMPISFAEYRTLVPLLLVSSSTTDLSHSLDGCDDDNYDWFVASGAKAVVKRYALLIGKIEPDKGARKGLQASKPPPRPAAAAFPKPFVHDPSHSAHC